VLHIRVLYRTAAFSKCAQRQCTKGRNVNLTDSSNYRGIALCAIFVKIFDHIVLSRYQSKLITSDLQFGFKAK